LYVEYIGATGKFIHGGIIEGCLGTKSSIMVSPIQWMVLLLYDDEGLANLDIYFKI